MLTLPAILCATLLTQSPAAVDFDTEVIPILTRGGCNTGACHGSAAGRGGFKLSLLGGDTAADYDQIVHHLEGRRVNLARPESSLLITKPTEQLEHGGGTRLEYEGPEAKLLTRWIAAGSPRIAARQLVRLEVSPVEQVLDRVGRTIPLAAWATFDDGTRRDVTRVSVFTPDDAEAVTITAEGQATIHRRGQNTVLVRFLDRVASICLTVPLAEEPVDLAAQPRRNFIDEEILATLSTLRLQPLPPANELTLLRRTRLDLTGRLPAPDEIRDYLADDRPDKQGRLVDRLLQSQDFVTYWTLWWSQLLRIDSKRMDPAGAAAFHGWIHRQLADNLPLDELVRQILTAEGDSHRIGPANFHRAAPGPREQAEFVSEALLGVRLRCANCHNHPLDKWTQDDYHGLAALFARIERGREVRIAARGEVTHPKSGLPAVPRLPGERFLAQDQDNRDQLAAWITAPENPYFARALVNRLWAALLGRGLVEPVDDLRATNPATHPRLLEQLEDDFRRHGYDFRRTLRLIAGSAAYARGSGAADHAATTKFYAAAGVRPLAAEVLSDAIADVTGVWDRYGDAPLGTRAVSLIDSRVDSPSLDILGRCPRDGTCGDAITGGLPKTLHLINGPLINAKIDSPAGRLQKLLRSGIQPADVVEEFYLRALSRPPREQERAYWQSELQSTADAGGAQGVLEDLLWSLLACREFVTNH